jgi:hypothetical protein
MTIRRFVANPIPPELAGDNPLAPSTASTDFVGPEIAYDDWPEPLRSAVKSGRVRVEDLPYPVFNQLTGELNPAINLSDYD